MTSSHKMPMFIILHFTVVVGFAKGVWNVLKTPLLQVRVKGFCWDANSVQQCHIGTA